MLSCFSCFTLGFRTFRFTPLNGELQASLSDAFLSWDGYPIFSKNLLAFGVNESKLVFSRYYKYLIAKMFRKIHR